MVKRRIFSFLAFIVIMVLLVTGCGSKKMAYDNSTSDSGSMPQYDTNEEAVAPQEAADGLSKDDSYGGDLTNSSVLSSVEPTVPSQDKIIRRVIMNVETQDFDNLVTTIDEKIKQLGGYVESSSITGQRYYYSDESRYAKIIARIPSDKLDEFTNKVGEISNVVTKDENTDNVTLQYVDTQSRKKSLEIEQERLFALLEKTDSLDNIIK